MIEVLTLGNFDIRRANKSLIEKDKGSYKRMELLKFLVTHRERDLTPEYISDNLWHSSESTDPRNALRTQVFRLRKMLKDAGLTRTRKDDGVGYINVTFQNGFYNLDIGGNYSIDTTHFEENIEAADEARDKDIDQAIDKYVKAIDLYRGEYMADSIGSEWVFMIRNRYQRLYVKSLIRLFGLLKKQGRHGDIIEHFEQAVCYEPFEEALHVFFLEALLDLGEFNNALSHYNYITGRMYRELSVNPSPVLKSLYSRIAAGGTNIQQADLSALSKSFADADDGKGALCCDIEYFRTIYNLEERRSLRARSNEYIGLVTIDTTMGGKVSKKELNGAAENLKLVLKESLRKGDVFTKWNDYQMIVLLTDVQQDALTLIGKRIKEKFSNIGKVNAFTVDISFKPITAEKEPFFA